MRRFCRLGTVALVAGLAACGGDSRAGQEARIAQGDEFLEQGKLSEALIEYQAAVQLNDRNG